MNPVTMQTADPISAAPIRLRKVHGGDRSGVWEKEPLADLRLSVGAGTGRAGSPAGPEAEPSLGKSSSFMTADNFCFYILLLNYETQHIQENKKHNGVFVSKKI